MQGKSFDSACACVKLWTRNYMEINRSHKKWGSWKMERILGGPCEIAHPKGMTRSRNQALRGLKCKTPDTRSKSQPRYGIIPTAKRLQMTQRRRFRRNDRRKAKEEEEGSGWLSSWRETLPTGGWPEGISRHNNLNGGHISLRRPWVMAVVADANDLGLITTGRPAQVSWALWIRLRDLFLLFLLSSISSALELGLCLYDINKRNENL